MCATVVSYLPCWRCGRAGAGCGWHVGRPCDVAYQTIAAAIMGFADCAARSITSSRVAPTIRVVTGVKPCARSKPVQPGRQRTWPGSSSKDLPTYCDKYPDAPSRLSESTAPACTTG